MKFFKAHKMLVFYITVIAIGILVNLIPYNAAMSLNETVLKLEPKAFTSGGQTLEYRMLAHGEAERMVFSTVIVGSELANLTKEDHYAVSINHLDCQAYSVYFNETFLGTVGDMRDGNSNIWNSTNHFYIERNLVSENNVLKIDTLSDYQRGLSAVPVYIMPASLLSGYKNLSGYFSEGINFLAMGLSLFGCLTAFMLYLVSFPKNTSFLVFSFALLFLVFYTLDYTHISILPFNYLTYKKLIMASLYISVSLASFGMYKFFHNKSDLVMSVITLSGYALIAVLARDMISFKMLYSYFNLSIIVSFISWLITSHKHFRKTDEAKMFFFGTVLLLLFSLVNIFSTLTGVILILNTPFVFSLIFSMTASILFFREFLHKDMQIQIVNNAHKESYFASITDGMTGLYNHRYLTHILHQTRPPFSVAMIDIDNFKDINDSFGHRFGDEIICYLATNLTNHVRGTDYVFRYGGDEFFIIFPGCSADNARDVVLKIKHKINENSLKYQNNVVPITFSGGIYYVETTQDVESIFDRVDNPLYKSKKEGKDRVTIYSSLEE